MSAPEPLRWTHEFTIVTHPPRWFRRRWKAVAYRQRVYSGASEIMGGRQVQVVGHGDTRQQAIVNVQYALHSWAARLDAHADARNRPETYTVQTRSSS